VLKTHEAPAIEALQARCSAKPQKAFAVLENAGNDVAAQAHAIVGGNSVEGTEKKLRMHPGAGYGSKEKQRKSGQHEQTVMDEPKLAETARCVVPGFGLSGNHKCIQRMRSSGFMERTTPAFAWLVPLPGSGFRHAAQQEANTMSERMNWFIVCV